MNYCVSLDVRFLIKILLKVMILNGNMGAVKSSKISNQNQNLPSHKTEP
jgi:hypothetical protein